MAAQAAQVRTTRQRMSERSIRKGSAGARPSGITRPGLSVISRTDQRIDSASRTSGSAAQAKRTLRGRMVLWMAVVLVVVLSTNISKMNTTVARLIFYLYAASMGFTLSVVFGVYGLTTIGLAFGLSSLFFLVLTMIGLTTKRNLLAWGPILFAALLTLVVVEILLMIFNAGGATMLISGISIVLFAGFTAYDAQKTRVILGQYQGQPEMIKKVSILCALDLYLDFINFFVSLLQLLGGSSD